VALDPRRFLVANCSKDRASHIKKTAERSDFAQTARFVSGIEGLGDINDGLRDLVVTSDVIAGGGNSPLPAGSSDELGSDFVLSTVAINPREVKANASLSPDVVNRGIGAADQIWEQVDAGTYNDISDLPQAAADLLNLKTFADKIFIPGEGVSTPDSIFCQASPYAMDLISRPPKNKFMFIVQFNFSPAYKALDDRLKTFTFVVKQSDRPTVVFDYEDINLYNFKTKAIKRSTYNPINMRFYDDQSNEVMQFYNSYLRAMVPVSNMSRNQQSLMETSGMNFDQLNQGAALGVPTHPYSASVGPLLNNEKSVLKEVTLYHVFGNGHLLNIYRLLSPKILELQLDELNMADSGEGNEVSLSITYDGLYIEANQSTNIGLNPETNIENLTRGGNYPLHYINPKNENPPSDSIPFGNDATESTNTELLSSRDFFDF
jgi:hypothetical protein